MKLHSILLFLAAATIASAQNAQLSGLVSDSQNAVIPNAEILVMNQETGIHRTAKSNLEGYYTVPALSPGRYKVTAQARGFQTVSREGIKLEVEQNARLDFKLSVGTVEQAIRVSAVTPLVNSETPAVSTVVTREQVENMPLNGRSFQSLIELTPGVVLRSQGSYSGQFSVDGQRTYGNNFMVDGVSANAGGLSTGASTGGFTGQAPTLTSLGTTQGLLSVDALQEFRIQTSNYAPEFGRGAGAQIELVSRSGTNSFHGTLFEYLRNEFFDANDWFANQAGHGRAPMRQNDFGGTFGGPVRIPRYDGRNRTFFFFSYEGLRLRLPQSSVAQVPSLFLRQQAPAALQPFLNAVPIPTGPNLLDTQGQPTGLSPFFDSHSDPSSIDAISIRVDHNISDRLTLFGTFADTPSQTSMRTLNSVLRTPVNTVRGTAGAIVRISPNTFDDLRVGVTHLTAGGRRTLDSYGGSVVPPDSVLFPGPVSPSNSLVQYGFFNVVSVYTGLAAAFEQRQINIVDSLVMSRGSHSLKFGVDYRRTAPVMTTYSYLSSVRWSTLADILSGTVSSATIQAGLDNAQPVFPNWSVYAQDIWKVTPSLSLTYGLRWDVNPAPRNSSGPNPTLLTNTGDPAHIGFQSNSDLYPTRLNDFAPRVGIAWRLRDRQGWQTVLRGGTGLFYDVGESESASVFFGYPFSLSRSILRSSFPLTAVQMAPPVANSNPPNGAVFGFGPGFNLPYTFQWNVALEQSLTASQILTVSYVGNLSRRLLQDNFWEGVNSNFSSTTTQQVYYPDATSDYDALQAQFQRRFSRGLQVLASYTWAHAIDDLSSDGIGFPPWDRANSDFDARHNASAAISYELTHRGSNRPARALLNGWGSDIRVQVFTGTPVNLQAGSTAVGGLQGPASYRPDRVVGFPLYLDDPSVPGGRRFNPAALAFPPKDPVTGLFTRQGTFGRNILRNLPASQIDFSLHREFALTEQWRLQFRAEAFNILNHPNFGGLGTNVVTPTTLGVPTQMLGRALTGLSPLYQIGGPRSLQFSARVKF